MNIKSKNGFSIIEILITLLIIAVISVLITTQLAFGLRTYQSSTKQIAKHDIITDSIQRIRKDIKEAYMYKVDNGANGSILEVQFADDTQPVKWWRLYNGSLSLKVGSAGSYQDIVKHLDTTTPTGYDTRISRFQKINTYIYMSIKPENVNMTWNYNEPIITEFSVEYKKDKNLDNGG